MTLNLLTIGGHLLLIGLASAAAQDIVSELQKGPLSSEEVHKLLSAVDQPESDAINIGRASLTEIVNLGAVHEQFCLKGNFEERLDSCERASVAHIANVDNYCRDKLDQLAQKCVHNANSLIWTIISRIDFMTLAFFQEQVFKGTSDNVREKDASIIEEFLGKDWRERSPEQSDFFQAKNLRLLNENCRFMTGQYVDLKSLKLIFAYAREHGIEPPQLDAFNDFWLHVYDMCKLFLSY